MTRLEIANEIYDLQVEAEKVNSLQLQEICSVVQLNHAAVTIKNVWLISIIFMASRIVGCTGYGVE